MINISTEDKTLFRGAEKWLKIDVKGEVNMKKRVIIQLEEEKKEMLQKKATEQQRSLSNFINWIIDLYLKEED